MSINYDLTYRKIRLYVRTIVRPASDRGFYEATDLRLGSGTVDNKELLQNPKAVPSAHSKMPDCKVERYSATCTNRNDAHIIVDSLGLI